MYQFTTTRVLNSNTDVSGVTIATGSTSAFEVKGTGKFKKAGIVSVYKRPYSAGVKEIAQITVPASGFSSGDVIRLAINIKVVGIHPTDYASVYLDFNKPIVIEVIAGTQSATATAIAKEFNKLKDRFGYNYATAVASTNDVIFTARDTYQRFTSIQLSKAYDSSTNTMVQPQYTDLTTSFSVTTPGAEGFGDYAWMLKTISIPTLEKQRFFALGKDELPILGGNYSQYTLQYSIEKDEMGIVAGAKSITTHVFYVKSDVVSAFETALSNALISANTVNVTATNVSIATASVTTAATANGVQLVATTTPSGMSNVVYELRPAGNIDASGSGADFTKVSITGSGVMTFASGHGIVATDTIGLTVTVDGVAFATTVTMVS